MENTANTNNRQPNTIDSRQPLANDRGFAIAAIIASIPTLLWASLVVILFGFIILALWFNHSHLETFTNETLNQIVLWFVRLMIGAGAIGAVAGLWQCYKMYHQIHIDIYARRSASAAAQKQQLSVRRAEIQNEQLELRLDLERMLPQIVKYALDNNHNIQYDGKTIKVENYLSNLHMMQGIEPPAAAAPQIDAPVIHTFRELLDAGVIQEALRQGKIVLGYEDEKLRYGTLEDDVRSCGIGGVSGGGKTTGVRFLLYQGLLMGAKLLMIDPHLHEEEESLAAQFMMFKHSHIMPPCDDKDTEVAKRIKWLVSEYEKRKARGIKGPAIFVVIDEFNELMRTLSKERKRELIDPLLNVAQGGRKFGIFCILIGQRWSDRDLGGEQMGAAIRGSLHTSIAYRFKEEAQAAKLIGGGDAEGRKCLDLARGHNYFRDTDGQLSKMITPNTTWEDGARVQQLLEVGRNETTVESTPASPEKPHLTVVSRAPREQIAQQYEPSFQREKVTGELENTDETTTKIQALARQVMRLQADGVQKPDIMRQLWKVNPGASDGYKAANQEYQEVMRYIAQQLGA